MEEFKFTSFYIDYNGFSIQCYKIGDGPKTLLSFPSYPHSGLSYTFFTKYHPIDSHTIITFDIPGWIGYSENIFKNSKFDALEIVKIARKILQNEHINQVDIIGYSFGGSLAVLFTERYSELVNKVVLVSTILNNKLLRRNRRYLELKLLKLLNKPKILRNIMLGRYKKIKRALDKNSIPEIFEDRYKEMMSRSNAEVLLDSLYDLFSADYTRDLIKISNKNIAVVNSRGESKMFRDQAHYIRKLLPQKTSLYLNGSHDDFLLRSQNIPVKDVIEFLEK